MRRRHEGPEEDQQQVNTIVFDTTSGNPKNISGDVNGKVIRRICSKWRRCMAVPYTQIQNFRKISICYLDNNNSSYWHTRNGYLSLTGEHGLFMVHKPRFFYRIDRKSGGKVAINIAEMRVEMDYMESPESLIGAVAACVSGDKVGSYIQQDQKILDSYHNVYTKLVNIGVGSGLQFIDWEQHCMIALMYCAKYGDRNSGKILGVGDSSYKTGSTVSLGNNDTSGSQTLTTSNNFLGIESVFGLGAEALHWQTDRANGNEWTIRRTSDVNVKFTPYSDETDGYFISDMLFTKSGTYFDLVPTADGGSSTTNYCDYYTQNQQGFTNSLLYRGGGGESSGVFCIGAGIPADANTLKAFRLAFRGAIDVVEDPEEFKKLVV